MPLLRRKAEEVELCLLSFARNRTRGKKGKSFVDMDLKIVPNSQDA